MSSSAGNKTGFDLYARGKLHGDEGARKAHKAQGKKAFDRVVSSLHLFEGRMLSQKPPVPLPFSFWFHPEGHPPPPLFVLERRASKI
jgi:hypothetical protein